MKETSDSDYNKNFPHATNSSTTQFHLLLITKNLFALKKGTTMNKLSKKCLENCFFFFIVL